MRNTRSNLRRTLATALLAAGIPVVALAGDGNLITVTSDADVFDPLDQQCSLREAIRNANTNTQIGMAANECEAGSGSQTDVIVLADGATYTLSSVGDDDLGGDLDIADDPDLPAGIVDLQIKGPDAGDRPVILKAIADGRVLEIVQADTLLSDLIVRNGAGEIGGGIYNVAGSLHLVRVGIHGNSAMNGGGIYSTGPLVLDNADVVDNDAEVGGGLSQQGATLSVKGGSFVQNSAAVGGGIYADLAVVKISDGAAFSNNSAPNCAGIVNTGSTALNVM